MTCESIEQMLDDYVDGALDRTATRDVEAHLGGCGRCRAELDAQRALLARVADAPRSAAPSRDLWPEIERARGESLARPARRWNIGWMQIAAAVLLMALSSAATVAMLRHRPAGDVLPATPRRAVAAQVRLVDAQYLPVANDLAALLASHRAELAPSTIATVERSLRVIDEAIAEARAALASDPNNPDLVDLLSAGYRQKIDLLRRTTQLTPRT
ncbi:MAG: zf-HC2 domain-containing protein [Gemmatimonadaceae bacterium]